MTATNPYRKNGISRPYSSMQMSTWVALPVLLIQFGLFATPVLSPIVSIPVTLVFCAAAIVSTYYAVSATVTDPMDAMLARHLSDDHHTNNGDGNSRPNHQSTAGLGACCFGSGGKGQYTRGNQHQQRTSDEEKDGVETTEATKYCWVCETDVAEHSMHCKYCNKCVANFDHHCQWLNNCIGKANYQFFYMTLWSIACFLVTHLAVLVGIVVDIFLKGPTERRAEKWFNAGLSELVAGVNLFFIVFDLVALSLIIQLLVFHIKLRRDGLTTYHFILKDNQRKRDNLKITEARKAKRIVAIGTARREDQGWWAVKHLQLGAYCTLCDPLPKDDVEDDAGESPRSKNRNSPRQNGENNMTNGDHENGNKQSEETKNGDDELL